MTVDYQIVADTNAKQLERFEHNRWGYACEVCGAMIDYRDSCGCPECEAGLVSFAQCLNCGQVTHLPKQR